MCTQRLNRDNFLGLCAIFLLGFHWLPVFALSTDENQIIEIEAETGELDDQNNISIYTGNVITTQGSIRMTGDKMTVHFNDNNDMEILLMVGRPATYRQLPDDSNVYDEAEALTMEYYELRNLVVLKRDGVVTQEKSTFTGECIEYDTVMSRVKAWSVTCEDRGKQITDPSKIKRIKITIKPKEKQ